MEEFLYRQGLSDEAVTGLLMTTEAFGNATVNAVPGKDPWGSHYVLDMACQKSYDQVGSPEYEITGWSVKITEVKHY